MTGFVFALAAFLTVASAASAQERPAQAVDPMAATVAQWFTMIERQFVSLADAMPADRWSFAPKDGQFKGVRTFAEQVKHVACANVAFFNEVEHKTPPAGCETGGPGPGKNQAELMQDLRGSVTYATPGMRRLTPAHPTGPGEGPVGGETARM